MEWRAEVHGMARYPLLTLLARRLFRPTCGDGSGNQHRRCDQIRHRNHHGHAARRAAMEHWLPVRVLSGAFTISEWHQLRVEFHRDVRIHAARHHSALATGCEPAERPRRPERTKIPISCGDTASVGTISSR